MNEMQFHENRATFSGKSAYEKIRRFYDFKKGEKLRILDVGCGNGKLAEYLVGLRHEVVGIDAQIASEKKDSYTHIQQDLSLVWKVAPDYFDMVICTDVAEHLYNPTHILKQSELVLKSGGLLIFGVPNHFDLRQRLRMFFGKGIVHWDNVQYGQKSWDYSHVRFFSLKDLGEMFQSFNWQVEQLQLNFMGGGLIPTRLTPTFLRAALLNLWPNLFSGKFIFCMRKSADVKNESLPKIIRLPFTPKDF